MEIRIGDRSWKNGLFVADIPLGELGHQVSKVRGLQIRLQPVVEMGIGRGIEPTSIGIRELSNEGEDGGIGEGWTIGEEEFLGGQSFIQPNEEAFGGVSMLLGILSFVS